MPLKQPILVDGGYFLKRYRAVMPGTRNRDPQRVARDLFTWALLHLDDKDCGRRELYRIFYYDCPPITKKAHHPLTKRAIDFSKTPEAQFRVALHRELTKLRKVALRLGRLSDFSLWAVRPDRLKQLLSGEIKVGDLSEADVFYEVRQKGVDMRIGLDIASLAFKRQVDQIILSRVIPTSCRPRNWRAGKASTSYSTRCGGPYRKTCTSTSTD